MELGKGFMNKRIYFNTNDEIEDLGNAFNNMAVTLENNSVSKNYLESIINSMNEIGRASCRERV